MSSSGRTRPRSPISQRQEVPNEGALTRRFVAGRGFVAGIGPNGGNRTPRESRAGPFDRDAAAHLPRPDDDVQQRRARNLARMHAVAEELLREGPGDVAGTGPSALDRTRFSG